MALDDIVTRTVSNAGPPSGNAQPPRAVQDQINFNEGTVILIYPANLSEKSLVDLSDWVALIGRKIQRVVKERV